jgi:hypothetical protein
MAYWMAAAALAPVAMQLMMPKPKMPGAPDFSGAMNMVNAPELQRYRAMMLNNAFNPQANLNRIASEQAMAQINRAAAARGLGNSGMAMGAISQAQADIANKFLMSESERQRMAFAAASGQLSNAGQIASQQAQAGYQHAIDAYNAKVQGQQALVGGLSGALGTGISAYQYGQQMDLMKQMADQQRLQTFMMNNPGYQQPAAMYNINNPGTFGGGYTLG